MYEGLSSFDTQITIEEVGDIGFSDYLMIEEEAELYEDCENEIMFSAATEDELDIMSDEDDIEDEGEDILIDSDDESADSLLSKGAFADDDDSESIDFTTMDAVITDPSEADIVDDYIDNELNGGK